MSFIAAAQVSFAKFVSLVTAGAGFRLIAAGALIEAGDEYCSRGGLFLPLPTEFVGQPVPDGMAVRRSEGGRG